MKKILSLSMLAIMSATFTFAQSAPLHKLKAAKLGKTLAHLHKPAIAAKTTAGNASRCIAEAYAPVQAGAYVADDSITYAYTGTWGSYGSPVAYGSGPGGQLKFTTAFEYLDGGGGYSPAYKVINAFDANQNITIQLVLQWNSATSMFDTSYRSLFTYDADNNNLTNTFQTWSAGIWNNNGRDIYSYSGHLLLSDLNQYWDTTWENSSLDTFHYNVANKVDTDLYKAWDVTTSSWDNSFLQYYVYDASSNLTENYAQFWDMSSGWINSGKSTYSDFMGSNPLVSINWGWDGSQYFKADSSAYTYNSYGQLTDMRSQTWDTSSSSWLISDNDGNLRLYYEEYTTAVKNVVSDGGTAKVYPIPANGTLSVEVSWDAPQAFTISLYNVQGAIVRQVQLPATAHYKEDLQVSDLPSGNYMLKVDGTKGNLNQKVSIVR